MARKIRQLKLKYWLLGLLILGTVTVTTNFYPLGMAGVTTFVLAYLTKGIRRQPKDNKAKFSQRNQQL